MSNRLDLELDTALPEDRSDSLVGEWDDDLLDDFPADDPAAFDGPMTGKKGLAKPTKMAKLKEATRTAKAPKATKEAKAANPARTQTSSGCHAKKALPARHPSRKARAGLGVSLSVGALVVLGGLMLGAGVLLATGNNPEAMLDFSGLLDLSGLGDLSKHPVNAFWVSLLVVLLAGALATVGVQRSLRAMQERLTAQDGLLAAVGTLDPDVPESWRQEVLLADADLATVTGNLLGHYHLQQAKLARYVGLEGELHRLENAMAGDSQDQLQGNWENPCAGSLADQASRLLVERNEQAREAADKHQMLASQGPDLVSGLRDACRWQTAHLDQVNQQGAIAERISRKLGKLAANRLQDEDAARRQERFFHAVAAIRDELAALPARSTSGRDVPAQGVMASLTERASRLAFQIAMEVARLGAKGERLLPLTQDLEEMTTELRAQIDSSKTQPGETDTSDEFIEKIKGRLAELDPQAVCAHVDPDIGIVLNELVPQVNESSAGLIKLSQNFGLQVSRLKQLNEIASSIVGVEVEELDDTSSVSERGMLVDRYDPFAASSQPPGGLVADPFTGSSGSIFDASPSGNGDFAHQILPGEEDSLLSSECPEPSLIDLKKQEDEPVQESEPGLSLDDEKVYDLAEFDAQLLTPDPMLDTPAARVYDLSEFDAVRIA